MGAKSLDPQIERVLKNHASLSHLQTLVDSGCNHNELVIAMQLAFLADESWETLVGMDLRAFKRTLALIKNCADIVDRLNRSEFLYRLSIDHRDPSFLGLHESPTLPERIREYASLLEARRKVFGPKRKITERAWKAWIVAHVIEDTKKPHDLEVSSLIAATLDDPKYSEKAHQAWRLKHRNIIKTMVGTLRERRQARLKTLPSPPR